MTDVVLLVVVVVVVAGVVVVVVGASVIFDATFLWLSGRVFIDNYSALRKATAGVSRVGFRCFFPMIHRIERGRFIDRQIDR